jgi:uncharacterized cupin superfamily protein
MRYIRAGSTRPEEREGGHMATSSRTAAPLVIPEVSSTGAWDLAENATMRLPGGRFATVVRIERGTVLVTQEGDLEDHVLEAGDELVLPPGGLAVAWAFTGASISLRRAALAGPRARPPGLQAYRGGGRVLA